MILKIFLLLIVLPWPLYWALGGWARYYKGPVSAHFDGQRFFNPGFDDDKTFADIRKWRRTSTPAAWPASLPPLPAGIPLSSQVTGQDMRVTFIGQATFLIQTGGLNILTDPFFSDRASPFAFMGPKRTRPPAIALKDLPHIDIVLLSHNHYDHLDAASLKTIWHRDQPVIVTPLGNDTVIRKAAGLKAATIHTLDWGQTYSYATGFRFTLEQAYHWSARGLYDRRRALWGAFIAETPGGKIYFAGDTGYRDGKTFREAAAKHGPFRLALLPVGAYEPRWFMESQHMNPDDAVRAHLDLGAPYTFGMHFGTVRLTDEAIDQPARDLAAAQIAHNVTPDRFGMPIFGKAYTIP